MSPSRLNLRGKARVFSSTAIWTITALLLVACADRRSLALLPLEAEGISPDIVAEVESALASGLRTRRPVIGPAEVRRKMGPGCGAQECTDATARALKVAELVSGRLFHDPSGWKVQLVLRTPSGEFRPTEKAAGNLGDLLEKLRQPGLFQD